MAGSERWRRLRKSNRTWESPWLPASAGLLGGLFAALTATALGGSSLAPLWAFLFGALALAVPILTVQHGVARLHRELRALINIRPLTGSRLLSSDSWAMDAVFAERLLGLLGEGHEQIVECGSGHSTVMMAARLEERGGAGHVTALEHLEEFADRTRRWLEERGLEDRATVVHAPIEDHDVEGRTVPWYARDALARLPGGVDLLLVDGPPEKLGPMARWPAVPLLEDRLEPEAVVYLDDGDRPDERRTAAVWADRLGARPRYVPGGRGGWLLRLGG